MSNSNVCWINGSYYQRQQLINNIISQLGSPTIYRYGQEDIAQKIAMNIMQKQGGVFDQTNDQVRLVILSDLPKFSSKTTNKKWCQTFDKCSSNCYVVINNIVHSYHTTIYSHVKKNGKTFQYLTSVQKADAVNLIVKKFQQQKKQITQDQALFLANILQKQSNKQIDYDEIICTINNIILYVGNDRKITTQHINSIVQKRTKFIIWQLFDSLDRRDYCKSQSIVNSIHEDDYLQAVNMIFTMCRWRYKMLLSIKSIVRDRKIDNAVTSQVLDFFNKYVKADKQQNTKPIYNQQAVKRQFQQRGNQIPKVNIYSFSQLQEILSLVQDAIMFIRTQANDIQIKLACEILIMKICGVIQKQDMEYLVQFVKNE